MPSDHSYMLDFILEEYPSNKIILSSNYSTIEKLRDKVKEELEKEDNPLNIVLVKGKVEFLRKLAERLEKLRLHLKINNHGTYLTVDMPESRTHREMREMINISIGHSLRVGFNTAFFGARDWKVVHNHGTLMPDGSYRIQGRMGGNGAEGIPSMVFELAVTQDISTVTNRILDWLLVENSVGDRVEAAIAIRVDFQPLNDGVDRDGSTSIYAKRVSFITYSLYLRNDLYVVAAGERRGESRLVERRTVKYEVYREGDRIVPVLLDPVCLLARRWPRGGRRHPDDRRYRQSVPLFPESRSISVPRNTFEGDREDEIDIIDEQTLEWLTISMFEIHEELAANYANQMGWH